MSIMKTPMLRPIMPAMAVSTRLSLMICEMMSRGRAPMARRTPISRVRSLTVTIIMLLMPITPASSVPMPTSQISASIPVKSMVNVANCSAMLITITACLSVGAMLFCRRRMPVMSSMMRCIDTSL